MSSMIYLTIGRLQIDWGQNRGFVDHSPLFQESDLVQVPYHYVDHENGDYNRPKTYVDSSGEEKFQLFVEFKEGMSKPLSQVVDRLELLGYSLAACEAEFWSAADITELDTDRLPFEKLARAIAKVDVKQVALDNGEQEESFEKFFRHEIYPTLGLTATEDDLGDVHFHADQAAGTLSAYTILRLLSFNPALAELPVAWQFADIQQGGYAERETFVRQLDPIHRFLIVTEGSSDAKIIRHAFQLLKPQIADFFDFVDMEEGYPFSGTGNVHRFLQGLLAISIQNSVLVLYDNDAEGVWSFKRSSSLNLPENIKVLTLPEIPSFEKFDTVGPGGRFKANINGRAAAIECYLDVGNDACVRWTSFKSETETYQGELLGKTGYMRSFLSQKVNSESYDYSKIEAILDSIISACAEMRERGILFSLNALE